MNIILFLLLLASPLIAKQDILSETKTMDSEKDCSACKETIIWLQEYFSNALLYKSAQDVAIELCYAYLFKNLEECTDVVNNFKGTVSEIFAKRIFDPDLLCTSMNKCSRPVYEEENFHDWTTSVMEGKPENNKNYEAEIKLTAYQEDSDSEIGNQYETYLGGNEEIPAKAFTFAHISDIHIDLEYKEGTDDDCEYTTCCRSGVGLAGS